MRNLIAWLLLCSLPAAAEEAMEVLVLNLSNQARQQVGLRALTLDHRLSLAAQQHAQEMDRLNYFGHASPLPEFATLARRMHGFGCYGLSSGENLHREQGFEAAGTAERAVRAWLASPQHRRNLLNPKYNRMGLGISRIGEQCTLTQDLAYTAIEVLQQRWFENRLSLHCQVSDGPLHGAVLFQGRRCANWTAQSNGQFLVEVDLPGPGTVSLGQSVGEREWIVETEWALAGWTP